MEDKEKLKISESALKEVALGRGPFKCDPLEHAESCIETMKEIARNALKLEYLLGED